MSGVTIAQGGVLPNIQAVLLPKKSQGAGGASAKEKASQCAYGGGLLKVVIS